MYGGTGNITQTEKEVLEATQKLDPGTFKALDMRHGDTSGNSDVCNTVNSVEFLHKV